MPDTDGVLSAIDACLEDYAISEDAMRWAPDEPDPTLSLDGAIPAHTFIDEATTLDPSVIVRFNTDFSVFVEGLQRSAEVFAESFGKAFEPVMTGVQAAFHKLAYRDDRRHFRRCPTCNPAGFPKGMSIDRGEYTRRRRRRTRR